MNTKENQIITIVIVCDNHLVVMLAALLNSLQLNCKEDQQVSVYIVNDNISNSNIKKINNILACKNVILNWKNLSEVIPADVNLPLDRTSFPVCAYARLCAPFFLPTDVTKAIYLDVDMLILKDIRNLWDIDIGDNVIGAVLDRSKVVSCSWGGIKNYKELGLNPEAKYFNSGLMVINLQRWRAENITHRVIKAINDNLRHVTFADQYGLNVVFAEKWFELDTRWNSFAQGTEVNPYIIHFTGMKPIFRGYNFNKEYADLFYHYLNKTPWSNFTPQAGYNRKLKKIWNIFTKKYFRISNLFINDPIHSSRLGRKPF